MLRKETFYVLNFFQSIFVTFQRIGLMLTALKYVKYDLASRINNVKSECSDKNTEFQGKIQIGKSLIKFLNKLTINIKRIENNCVNTRFDDRYRYQCVKKSCLY